MIVPIATKSKNIPSLSIDKVRPLVNRSPLNRASLLVNSSASKSPTSSNMLNPSLPLKHSVVQPELSQCNLVHTSPSNTASPNQHTSTDISSDVQIVAAAITTSLPIDNVLQQLNIKKHTVKGDGSCLYHALSHQAGFISSTSQGNESISQQLRKLAVSIMQKYPDVRIEDNLPLTSWSKKQQDILDPNNWGGDLEVRLLAIGLHRDVVVITASNAITFARKFPSQPPPLPKMRGGVFIPLTTQQLCDQWRSWKPSP